MELRPISVKHASVFVAENHRHHDAPQGAKFALAAWHEGQLVGVAMVGRPVSRRLDNGTTAEVIRVATDGTRNACSFLYGAAKRAAVHGRSHRGIASIIIRCKPKSVGSATYEARISRRHAVELSDVEIHRARQ